MFKKTFINLILILLLFCNLTMGQGKTDNIPGSYEKVEVTSIKIKHQELWGCVKKIALESDDLFTIESAGKSFEGRDINIIKVGRGAKKVLMWSQMHGDEPTATLAILDILNYFAKNYRDKNLQKVFENLQILILPMVNPDGVENFTRRNAQDIDINRDAQRLQTPEAKALKSVRDKYSPEFAFNLHDQDPYFAVGNTDSLVTIALLAPAIDEKNSTDKVRKKAKQLTSYLYEILSKLIPGHISRYDDEFEKRAFGDNMQAWGTSTITIESGGWYSDPGKEKIRELNFITILSAIFAISDESYSKIDIKNYELIPFNKRNFYDLILRNCTINFEGLNTIIDIGINYDKELTFYPPKNRNGKIVDIGDLSTINGIEEINADHYQISSGRYFLSEIDNLKNILKSEDSIRNLLSQGITSIISESDANLVGIKHSHLNLFFLTYERYKNLRLMLNLEKPVIPNPEFLSKMQDQCYENPFIFRDKIKLNRFADLVLSRDGIVSIVFVNGIKVYENGKVINDKPGIIYLDR